VASVVFAALLGASALLYTRDELVPSAVGIALAVVALVFVIRG
jgi:hypothetical protein